MSELFKQYGGKTQEDSSDEEILICPHCGAENEEGAKYCAECGKHLNPVKQCPHCKSTVPVDADICEVCGAWLLEGRCKFCYAPLEEGAKFCSVCGNPVEGIICPQCGNLSYFDFCKHCGIPLTKQAHEAIEQLRNSEEFQAILRSISDQTIDETDDEIELKKMKEYKERLQKSDSTQAQKSSEIFNSGTDELIQGVDKAERSQEELKKLFEKLQQKEFKNNQEARRFFGALKVLLPTIKRNPIGWRCNAYGVVHPEGPQGCSAPEHGGEWLFETITTIEETEI